MKRHVDLSNNVRAHQDVQPAPLRAWDARGRRILSAILTLSMVLSLAVPTQAAGSSSSAAAQLQLVDSNSLPDSLMDSSVDAAVVEPATSFRVVSAINGAPAFGAAQGAGRGAATRARLQDAIGKVYRSKPIEVGANLGQTFLFIITLAGIDMTLQEIRHNGLDPKNLSPSQLTAAVQKISLDIVSDGKLWTGWAGMSIATAAASKPAAILAELAAGAESRPKLALAIQNSILGTIGFFGWELGSQLWSEASMLIDDPKDFDRVSKTGAMAMGSFRALLLDANKSDVDATKLSDVNDLRLSKLMLSNVVSVLLTRDLLTKWMDHTWRLRIATGEFATFITAALAAGAIGSAIFPGGGTLVGIMFGLAGAGVSMAIPQQGKDAITYDFESVRLSIAASRLYVNLNDLQSRLRVPPLDFQTPSERVAVYQSELVRRRGLRSQSLTIFFERAFIAVRAIVADDTKPTALPVYRKTLLKSFSAMLKVTDLELKNLTGLEARATDLHSDDTSAIHEEVLRVTDVRSFLSGLQAPFALAFGNADVQDQNATADTASAKVRTSLTQFIESNRLNGFNEDLIVAKWRAARAK